MRETVNPADCPDPSVHGNPFLYCPTCSWTVEQDPEMIEERGLVSGPMVREIVVQVNDADADRVIDQKIVKLARGTEPRGSAKLSIVSTGDGEGTRVLVDGKELEGVTALRWEISRFDRSAVAYLTVDEVAIDAHALRAQLEDNGPTLLEEIERKDDLVAELRRQLTSLQRQVERLVAQKGPAR